MIVEERLPTILIVDAESLARHALERSFRASRFEVRAKSRLEGALEIIESEPLCLVLAAFGVHLAFNGLDVLREVRTLQPTCGRVLIADVAKLREIQEAGRAGVFDGVLQRPFEIARALPYVNGSRETGVRQKLPSTPFERAVG